jgi:uncharacterized membrane protein YgcG
MARRQAEYAILSAMINRKNAFLWLLIAVLVVVLLPAVVWLIAGIAAFVSYWLSIQFHPHRACRACGGSGRHTGSVWAYGSRPCGSCGGQGRHRRWGAQVFHRDQRVRAEARAGEASRRRARPL